MSKKDKGRPFWASPDGSAIFRWGDAVAAKAEDERSHGKQACQAEEKVDKVVEKHGRDVCPDPPPN